MNYSRLDQFERSIPNQAIGTAVAGAMVFNPVLVWSAFVAAGAGAVAGVSRAMTGRAEFGGARMHSVAVRRTTAKSAALTVPHAPVEALSRPILGELIEQTVVRDEAAALSPIGIDSPDDPSRPIGLDAPNGGKMDDLKRISGIGPKIEATLNGLGIYHFKQIAAWGADEARWIDEHLNFRGRVARDRWIEQAREMA